MKEVVEVFPPSWLLGIRFCIAGALLLAILWKRVKQHFTPYALRAGIILGILDYAGYYTQTVGLQSVTPGVNAFLTATYCVIVPFVWWFVARKRPTVRNIGAALLAVVGIWFVSVTGGETGFHIGFGEAMTLVCAVFFAIHMVYVSQFSLFYDVLMLTVFQFFTEGVLGLIVGASFETFPALSAITPDVIVQMAILIVFASVLCFCAMNIALAHVPPAQSSLILCLESVFGVFFSILLYGEQLTGRLILGFCLIFIAILLSEGLLKKLPALLRIKR